MSFHQEVAKFKNWTKTLLSTFGEWELEYPEWDSFISAASHFLDRTSSKDWDDQDWQAVIYAVARDNECKNLISIIAEDLELLVAFSWRTTQSEEQQAKWQAAAYLGDKASLVCAEPVLLQFMKDADEYVVRRSLLSLSRLGSEHTEKLAISAWDTKHLYQRIAALHALHNIGSNQLEYYLDLASEDGRQHLLSNATKLRERTSSLR
jgi:HEAT repeat protein